jgi:hypothetical protein
MGWKLFQILIVSAVIASNIEWKWTDNGYAAAFIAGYAAYAATCLLSALIGNLAPRRFHERLKQRLLHRRVVP